MDTGITVMSSRIQMPEVNLSATIYRLFHEDLPSIIGTNTIDCSQPSTCLIQLLWDKITA